MSRSGITASLWRGLAAAVLCGMLGTAMAQTAGKANVVVLATGGTIAGAGESVANSASY
jgi:glutamin-(asparagin-)ase